jgi:hypothetical protein
MSIGGNTINGDIRSFRDLDTSFPIKTLDNFKTAIVQKYPDLQLRQENLLVFKMEKGQQLEIINSKQLLAFVSSEDSPLIVKVQGMV